MPLENVPIDFLKGSALCKMKMALPSKIKFQVCIIIILCASVLYGTGKINQQIFTSLNSVQSTIQRDYRHVKTKKGGGQSGFNLIRSLQASQFTPVYTIIIRSVYSETHMA